MRGTLCVLGVLFVIACTTAAARAEEDHDVVLSLSAERPDYYIGEPLRLSLTVKNESDHDVYGFFRLWPPDERITLLYRRAGEPFRALGRISPDSSSAKLLNEVDVVSLPAKVSPQQEKRSEMQVVLDPATQQIVLGAAGDYEFMVECGLWSSAGTDTSAGVVTSDVAHVHVASPTNEHREALSEFLAKDLARLVETWPFPPPLEDRSIANAAAYLDRRRSHQGRRSLLSRRTAIFAETIRDYSATPLVSPPAPASRVSRDEVMTNTTAHEILYLFGLIHDGDRTQGAIMCAALYVDANEPN